jgi:hypothetical protein
LSAAAFGFAIILVLSRIFTRTARWPTLVLEHTYQYNRVMNFRTIEPVTVTSARRKVSPRPRSKGVRLLALMAALMLLALAAGLVWWAFV